MVEKERQPFPEKRRSWISFLDGVDATLFSVKFDAEKMERIFEFKPTPLMRWKHQIQDADYNPDTFRITKPFPDEFCHDATTSINSIRWFLLLDYNLKPTKMVELLNKKHLEMISTLKKENSALKLWVANKLHEDKKKAVNTEYETEKITRITKEILSAVVEGREKK